MNERYVVREVHNSGAGLSGIVALLEGHIWILAERWVVEAALIERRMTATDFERLCIVDAACKRRQIARGAL